MFSHLKQLCRCGELELGREGEYVPFLSALEPGAVRELSWMSKSKYVGVLCVSLQ